MTRRRFLKTSAGMAGIGGAIGLYTWRVEPHWLSIVRRDLAIAHLPAALDGASLVQISDLHVGPIVDSDYLIGVMRRISALRPDLMAITGDFVSYRTAHHVDDAARVLEHLEPGRLGCAAIMGNHDYGWGWRHSEVADRLTGRLTDLGLTVLRNESRSFGGLNVVGLDDLWGPNFNPQPLLAGLNRDEANLVLCHNPDVADLPIWSGYQGWMLCGHTHGGQCKPPFLPPPLLPVKNRRYTAGAFALADGRRLYINRGLGYLRRVRFNARPEVTLFRLVAV
ncbi:MAG: metallophosphoesterase [Planctomycetia bacterium]|nr:metallophosphoesterase [Planctomycetia bacterium]